MEEKIIDEIVGKNIRRLRSDRGLSQTKLGDALGVTFQQLQKYEKGQNRVCASKLYLLSRYFGVPLDEFYSSLGDDKPMKAMQMVKIARKIEKIEEKDRERIIDIVVKFVEFLGETSCSKGN